MAVKYQKVTLEFSWILLIFLNKESQPTYRLSKLSFTFVFATWDPWFYQLYNLNILGEGWTGNWGSKRWLSNELILESILLLPSYRCTSRALVYCNGNRMIFFIQRPNLEPLCWKLCLLHVPNWNQHTFLLPTHLPIENHGHLDDISVLPNQREWMYKKDSE